MPELADWMMSRFSENPEVWDEFMMGRHASFEVFGVPEGYEAAKDIASRLYKSSEGVGKEVGTSRN